MKNKFLILIAVISVNVGFSQAVVQDSIKNTAIQVKADQKLEKTQNELDSELKAAEKERKEAEKERKKKEKEAKNAEKAKSDVVKYKSKIDSKTRDISDTKRKMEKLNSRGKLSPVAKYSYLDKIAKKEMQLRDLNDDLIKAQKKVDNL